MPAPAPGGPGPTARATSSSSKSTPSTLDFAKQLEIWNKRTCIETTYTKLKDDRKYPTWYRGFKAKSIEDGFQRVCDYDCKKTDCAAGADLELYLGQLNFLGIVLCHTLETPIGSLYLTQYPNNPRKVWFEHHEYQSNSPSSKAEKQNLFITLNGLRIKSFPTRILFLTEWCRIQHKIDDISIPPMADEIKSNILQIAIKCDPTMVTTFSNYKQLRTMNNLPATIPFKDLY